jgi:hypothetical protein
MRSLSYRGARNPTAAFAAVILALKFEIGMSRTVAPNDRIAIGWNAGHPRSGPIDTERGVREKSLAPDTFR